MKSSVFPPKKQPSQTLAVDSMSTSDNEQAQLLDHESSVQVLLPVESKSRNRASAVVLGLALSMGTSSLLLPPQTKKVLAADSLPNNALLSLETASNEAPIAAPSPIASPVPSSLELALNQAANINPTVAPAGYSSVLKAGDELLNLSKKTLATPSPLAAVPTPDVSPTPTVTVAATLLPQATLTPETVPTVSPTPSIVKPEAATTANLPGFVLPLSDAAHATPAAESTVSLATPATTSQPSPTSTIVAPTPTPTVAASPQLSSVTPTAQPTVAPIGGIESPTRLDFTAQAISVTNGAEVSVLPQLKQLSADRSTVKLAAVPTPTPSSAASTVVNGVTSVATPEPKLIAQETEIQSLTALRPSIPASPAPAESLNAPETALTVSYRVNRGDTLNVIARQYGVSVAELIAANNIINPNQIEVNQELRIPQTSRIRLNSSVLRSTTGEVASDSSTTIASSGLNPDTRWSTSAAPVADITATSANPYIQNLQAEIEVLRAKYQQQSNQLRPLTPDEVASTQRVAPAAVATVPQTVTPPLPPALATAVKPPVVAARPPEPINPEFANPRVAPLPRSASAAWQGQSSAVRPVVPVQSIAVAPLAPAAYAPTIEAPGQSVSPELPPLAAANTYLPSDLPQSKGYIWPAKGVMTSGYGWRWGRMHRGLDIAAPTGTPIVASATGVVEYAQWNSGGYGYLVDIRHPDGSLTRYGHNNRLLVREGQRVQQGQLIAEMGSTGFSTGPHCHFEIHAAGQGAVNPIAYLPQNRG